MCLLKLHQNERSENHLHLVMATMNLTRLVAKQGVEEHRK